MLARVPIRAVAGLLLSQLLSVAFAQDEIDCRRRAAEAFAYTRQVAGQSHDAKRWANTLNQQLLTLGISKYPPAEPGALDCEPLKAAMSGR